MAFTLPASLSPSKVASFTDCALSFRFSVIDRLPEPPSVAATKGTLVHAALERLFVLPPADATLTAPQSLGNTYASLTELNHYSRTDTLFTAITIILGALLGGFIATALDIGEIDDFFDLGTWLIAIGGSVLLLLIIRAIAR